MFSFDTYAQHQEISRLNTFEHFTFNLKPAVFIHIMPAWTAYGKWTLSGFRENYGDVQLGASRLDENGESKYIFVSMKDYVDYTFLDNSVNPYYGRTTFHLSNTMKDEYPLPAHFSCWYKAWYQKEGRMPKIPLSEIYLGPKNSKSKLHKDIWGTSFWNALFQGKKLWLFYPSEQEHLLYNGQVDPFYPDLKKFPAFADTHPLVCTQEPGELVYCPSDVYHAVIALENSLALSENYINAENYLNVLNHFKEAKYWQAYNKLQKIAQENNAAALAC